MDNPYRATNAFFYFACNFKKGIISIAFFYTIFKRYSKNMLIQNPSSSRPNMRPKRRSNSA